MKVKYSYRACGSHPLSAQQVTASPVRDGMGPVLVPGEFERNTFAQRSKDGIPVAAGTFDELVATAVLVGIPEAEAAAQMKGEA